jgi:hypothetical protein
MDSTELFEVGQIFDHARSVKNNIRKPVHPDVYYEDVLLLEKYIEELKSQQEWVSVEEVPKDYGGRWVNGNDGVEVGYYDLEHQVYRDMSGVTINNPTHHMKIYSPNPPENKE